MIDIEKMKALAAELRKGSGGRYKWYAMGRDESSYFMDFDWGYDADRWFNDQQKSRSEWIEREGIHIVKKLFQTELETSASEAADAIDTLLSELEAAQKAIEMAPKDEQREPYAQDVQWEAHLAEAVELTVATIDRQLDLITERALGNSLDKMPVVRSLTAHKRRLERALAERNASFPSTQITSNVVDVDEVKQLCRDFSSRTGSVYIKDVEGALDGLASQQIRRTKMTDDDKLDAERYRWIRSEVVPFKAYASGNPNWTFSGYGPRGATFDEAVAAAIAQRKGGDDERA